MASQEYYPEDIETKIIFKHNNRNKKRNPKSSTFWCHKCDALLVHIDEKCRRCGSRNSKNRITTFKKLSSNAVYEK